MSQLKPSFHQGDPIAPQLFSLCVHPVIKKIAQAIPNLKVISWFLDDGSMVGSLEQLRKVVDVMLQHGPVRGLHLSTAKSTLWNLRSASDPHVQHQDPLSMGIRIINEEGTVLLRALIGSVEFERQAIKDRVGKVQEIMNRLTLLKDPQSEFEVLRSCVSQPKVMFMLRAINPIPHLQLWAECDDIIRETLCKGLGVSLSQQQRAQGTLTVAAGGLGLRAASDHCYAAYITSLLSSQELKLEILGKSAEECPPPVTDEMMELLQGKTGQEQSVARMGSLGLPNSGAWSLA